MKYKQVLILSDNLYICKQVSEILCCYDVNVTFKHSPGSTAGYLQELTGSKVAEDDILNLKSPGTVQDVVKKYDLVFSIHCKQLFPADLFNEVKCLNLHPGYNPVNRGWYPQVFAIINKTVLGATLHEITGDLDNGPIIDRELVEVYEWDTSLSAYNRVVEKEIELFSRNISNILAGSYSAYADIGEGFVSLKKDYKKLLEIDLDRIGTFGEFLDYLRALTHPPYTNAFFKTSRGEKVYVEILIKKQENE